MKSAAHCTVMLAAGLVAAQLAFSQGMSMEGATSGGPLGNQVMKSTTLVMPKMLKTVSGPENHAMIIRLDRKMIYEVSPGEKTYSATTFEEWEAGMKRISAKMNPKLADLQKRMESLPPEQRKMMEGLMPKKDAKIDVVNTGEKQTLLGYATTKYVVKSDDKEIMTLWVTKDIKVYESLKKDYEELSQRLQAASPMQGSQLVDALKKVGGVPLELTMAGGITQKVVKLDQRAIPGSEFEIPAGFTKVPSKILSAGEDAK